MFHLADVQTTCMSLYNFCVSITAVQSFVYSVFFLFTIGLQYIPLLKQKNVEKQYICIYMNVCNTCKFRRQALQDIVVPIQRAPRLLVDVTIYRLLDIDLTMCQALPGKTSFRPCISNLIKFH